MELGELISEKRKLVVLPKLAEIVGLNNALFLQQVQFFNQDKDIGDDWFECSAADLRKKYFPFWSEKTIKRITNELTDKKLLQAKKRNKNKFAHTLSYRINRAKVLESFGIDDTKNYSPSEFSEQCKTDGGSSGTSLISESPSAVEGSPSTDLPMLGTEATKKSTSPPGKTGRGNHLPRPEGVSPQVWEDFLNHRKNKRASLTTTALNLITQEAHKAKITLEQALEECLLRGWQGFKAEWYTRTTGAPPKKELPQMGLTNSEN